MKHVLEVCWLCFLSEALKSYRIQTRLRKFINTKYRKITLPSLRMRCCVYGHVRVSNLLCKTHVHDCSYTLTQNVFKR